MTKFRLSGSGASMFLRPPFLMMWTMVLASPLAAADTMRCGSRVVSVEAHAAEVLSACGTPDFRDVFSHPAAHGPGVLADIEQWTYNFGPNKLLHVLRLRNGRLVRIDREGYGFHRSVTPRCSPGLLVDGLPKYRLLQACGEPLTRRDIGFVPAASHHHPGRIGRSRSHFPVEVFHQEWVYNFGPRHPLKVVTLGDGTVVDVQNADRGFNP